MELLRRPYSRVRKKTWNKTKKRIFICGYCNWCQKELLNTMGGWIITHTKKHFCHDGKDGKSKGKSKLTNKHKTLPKSLQKKIIKSKSKKKK